MGLDNRPGGKYITILGGKFCVRVDASTPGAIARVNKQNKTVHEVFYDSFTGKLINIRKRESQYGPQWEFDFKDGKEVYTLQLSFSNSYATNLLKILPNVDLEKEMKVQPSQKIVEGKTKSSLFVSQDGVTLKHAYTKDRPNGLPQMVQVQVKGQLVWDDSARLAFLEAMVKSDILPKLPQQPVAAGAAPTSGLEFGDESGATGAASDDDF